VEGIGIGYVVEGSRSGIVLFVVLARTSIAVFAIYRMVRIHALIPFCLMMLVLLLIAVVVLRKSHSGKAEHQNQGKQQRSHSVPIKSGSSKSAQM